MKTRFLFSRIMERLPMDQRIIIITGPRQSGKTTLMKQMMAQLKNDGLPTFYFNLEDMDILSSLNQSPKNLLKLIPEHKKAVVFIDEVQYLSNPTNTLKFFYDEHREHIKLVVSGSSAFYIDTKFEDSLSGRKWLYVLYPMGFKEYLYFKRNPLYADVVEGGVDIFQPSIRKEVEMVFEEYCIYGGYPEVVTSDNSTHKKEILNDILHSYLKKDVKESGVKYEDKFYHILKILASQIGSLLNKHELSKLVGISSTAVENYLFILKKTFYVSLISPFSTKVLKEIIRMPKVYFFDAGIRNMLLKDFAPLEWRMDKGSLLENTVFKYFSENRELDEIKFWRKKAGPEIDFVINDHAYEVKYSLSTAKNQPLESFKTSNPDINLSVLYYHGQSSLPSQCFIPAFLLQKEL